MENNPLKTEILNIISNPLESGMIEFKNRYYDFFINLTSEQQAEIIGIIENDYLKQKAIELEKELAPQNQDRSLIWNRIDNKIFRFLRNEVNKSKEPINTTIENNPSISKDDARLNWKKTKWFYDAFFINMENNSDIDGVKRYIADVLNEFKADKINSVCHIARQEIESLIFENNNNSQLVIEKDVLPFLNKSISRYTDLINKYNPSYKENISIFRNIERIMSPLAEIYRWFMDDIVETKVESKIDNSSIVLDNESIDKQENPYQKIFPTTYAFRLFKFLKEKLITANDLSFIYRRMEKDGLINEDLKQKVFLNFLSKEYNITTISKIKTLNEVKGKYGIKENIYTTSKELFQS